MLTVIQQLTILSVMTIAVPAEPSYLIGIAVQLSQLDIIPTEAIYPNILEFDEEDDAHNKGLNPYFEFAGYSVMNSIINFGSAFIFLVANFMVALFLILLQILSRKI